MTSIPAGASDQGAGAKPGHVGESVVVSSEALRRENITLDPSNAARISLPFLGVGGLLLIVAIVAAVTQPNGLKHALGAYHVGFMSVLAITLGAMFWTMVMYLVNAGWFGPLRRQFENIFTMVGVCAALFVPILAIELFSSGVLFKWMNPEVTAGDVIYDVKAPFLNSPFFIVRAVIYFVVWGVLAYRLSSLSLEQDRTGDRWLTQKARYTSGWGVLLFALTTAFAGFDWLMTLDYHFFSTMWGVYFFAGGAFGSLALVATQLGLLRRAGRLDGVVTEEHSHDLGKLLFGFSVFWAYIAFSQYFLIYYSNIPEETAFYLARMQDWLPLTIVIVAGHFVFPFFVLLPRPLKRRAGWIGVVGALLLLVHLLDTTWVVRPMIYLKSEAPDPGLAGMWIDIAGTGGVVCVYLGFLIRRVFSVPLVAFNDPRIARGLGHKNYV
ncbi:MAG: hypothetical protein AAF108_03395 [Planctomycetota bacterium]